MMFLMRTTLTIEDHLINELKAEAQRTGKPFKQIVNEVIQAGLRQQHQPDTRTAYVCRTFSLGHPPKADLDKALSVAEVFEDEEVKRKLGLEK